MLKDHRKVAELSFASCGHPTCWSRKRRRKERVMQCGIPCSQPPPIIQQTSQELRFLDRWCSVLLIAVYAFYLPNLFCLEATWCLELNVFAQKMQLLYIVCPLNLQTPPVFKNHFLTSCFSLPDVVAFGPTGLLSNIPGPRDSDGRPTVRWRWPRKAPCLPRALAPRDEALSATLRALLKQNVLRAVEFHIQNFWDVWIFVHT